MKIQANAQTMNGTWGVMLSGWEPSTLPEPVFSTWLTQEEALALGNSVLDASTAVPRQGKEP